MTDRIVAQGNHEDGYRGAVIVDWNEASERVVARCIHSDHRTPSDARSCVARAWFHGADLADLVWEKQA